MIYATVRVILDYYRQYREDVFIYYTIYKTTCIINNKIYIGAHKTKNVNDDYLGSGKLLKRAIKKYGKDAFIKEVLFIFDNDIDMFAKERELITEEFVESDENYNCKLGGEANWYYINKNGLNHKSNQHLILSNRLKSNQKYAKEFAKKMSEVTSFRKLQSSKTPEERKVAAQKAANARWNRQRSGDGKVT